MNNRRNAGRGNGIRAAGLLLLLALLGACGGGSSATAILASQSVVLEAEAPVTIYFSGSFFSPSTGYPFQIGDDSAGLQALAVIQFDLSTIPVGAVVTSATLRIRRTDTVNDPSNLGPIRSDHIDWPLGAPVTVSHTVGLTLASDFDTVDFPTIQPVGAPPIGTIGVTTQVASDLSANRTSSAFRLRGTFATNTNGTLDVWYHGGIYPGNGQMYGTELTVNYTAP